MNDEERERARNLVLGFGLVVLGIVNFLVDCNDVKTPVSLGVVGLGLYSILR